MNTKESKIVDKVIAKFDFKKVHKIMEELGWEWGVNGVPPIHELKSTASHILMDAVHSGRPAYCATGGFEARIEYEEISLKFVVEEYSCKYKI